MQIRLLTLYYINDLKQEPSTVKHVIITGLMRRLSLIGIDATWQLSFGCLLKRIITSFLRYTGYLSFINDPISHVLLLTLVHILLPSYLYV